MKLTFTQIEIDNIAKTLGCEVNKFDEGFGWKLNNKESGQSLLCNVYTSAQLNDDNSGVLVSVQTQHGYFELHDCNAFMVFEPDEIIFLQSTESKLSSLIIGKNASCSLYSNISRDILGADFGTLDPAVLLSAMQLSLTDGMLPEL